MVNNHTLTPTLFFIFGGSGDLNYRKLTPALFNLFIDGSMPEKFHITGIARSEYAADDYQKHLLDICIQVPKTFQYQIIFTQNNFIHFCSVIIKLVYTLAHIFFLQNYTCN
jgi:glucose-6-phosphate 1-dehydrogenase